MFVLFGKSISVLYKYPRYCTSILMAQKKKQKIGEHEVHASLHKTGSKLIKWHARTHTHNKIEPDTNRIWCKDMT